MREFHVYFQHGTFDVLPILGMQPKRLGWWSEHYTECKNASGRRILITTSKVRTRRDASYGLPVLPPSLNFSFHRQHSLILMPFFRQTERIPLSRPSNWRHSLGIAPQRYMVTGS